MSLNTDLGAKLGKPWPRLCFINRLIESLRVSSITVKHNHRLVQAVRLAQVQGHRMERNNETCQNPNPFSRVRANYCSFIK